MDSFLTDDTKAIILLCGIIGKGNAVSPLTQAEYNSLAHWLLKEKLRPEALLTQTDLGEAAAGSRIDRSRLEKLLGRGVQLGFAVEEWQRNGLWIISRSDPEYPARYKNHLKEKAPPLLFGAGDKALLQGGGLAIVGSRNIDIDGEDFTRHVAGECVYNKIPVVSGGARGVDQIAMRTALEAGGQAIGVLADNLLKASIERHARYAIADGRLLLISPCHPQARFTVGTAMGRNKLIYGLADYGLIVSADHKKGGTWAGAEEELKRNKPIAVFVRSGDNVPAGNIKLLALGVQEWPKSIEQGRLAQQLSELSAKRPEMPASGYENLNLFDDPSPQIVEDQKLQNVKIKHQPCATEKIEEPVNTAELTVYDAALPVILANLKSPASANELAIMLDVTKNQLNTWLKKAVEEGRIRKLKKPVRYSL